MIRIGKGLKLETSAPLSVHSGNLILIKLISSDPKFRRTRSGSGDKGAAAPLVLKRVSLIIGVKILGINY